MANINEMNLPLVTTSAKNLLQPFKGKNDAAEALGVQRKGADPADVLAAISRAVEAVNKAGNMTLDTHKIDKLMPLV